MTLFLEEPLKLGGLDLAGRSGEAQANTLPNPPHLCPATLFSVAISPGIGTGWQKTRYRAIRCDKIRRLSCSSYGRPLCIKRTPIC